MFWCGASWVKRLRFWLNRGFGIGGLVGIGGYQLLRRVWYFSPHKKHPSA